MTLLWTLRAEQRFLIIRNYLEEEFGPSSAQSYQRKVMGVLTLLESFPFLGSLAEPKKNIYGFQVSPQVRVFYRVDHDRIVLLTFFDSRQDPGRLKNL